MANNLESAVAVVIPAYNYGRFVGRAVQSVLDQTLPPVEVVVVDDGSTDDTSDVLATFGSRIKIVRQENQGVAAARNRGVDASTAPLLAFIDADDSWHPKKLEAQVASLQAQPDAGLVHCGAERVDEDGRSLGRAIDGHGGWVAEDLLLLKPVIPLNGSGFLIPRAIFQGVGGFDQRLSTSADWELCLRIALQYPIVFIPEVLVFYTIHGSNMHGNLPLMERDVLLGYEKVFASHPELAGQRSQALSKLFMVLAGSHFASGNWRRAAHYGVKSIGEDPREARYIVEYPVRRFNRRRRGQAT